MIVSVSRPAPLCARDRRYFLPQLPHDIGAMEFCGPKTDAERVRSLLVRSAHHESRQERALPYRQFLMAGKRPRHDIERLVQSRDFAPRLGQFWRCEKFPLPAAPGDRVLVRARHVQNVDCSARFQRVGAQHEHLPAHQFPVQLLLVFAELLPEIACDPESVAADSEAVVTL
jgi:hypothetical protein